MNEGAAAGTAEGWTRFQGLATHPALAWRADIDGLRALAVSAVVVGHFWPRWLPGGYVGVDVFFVISGYLITQILVREMTQGRFRLGEFYARRARRLFPALFVVLACTWLASWFVLLPSDLANMLKALLATLLFSANLLFWRQSNNYFDATETQDNPLVHLWSLGVEEQFYLCFPWLLMAVLAWASHRAAEPKPLLKRLLWTLALLNLLLAGWANARNTTAAFYLSPLRAWEFLAGALAALHALPQAPGKAIRHALNAASLGAMAVLLACLLLYSERTPFPGWAALPPVLATAVLLYTGAARTAVAGALSRAPCVALGQVSYSLYLWHWPVLVLARHLQAGLPSAVWLPALLLLALGLSFLTWRHVEQPWRRRAVGHRIPAGLAWKTAAAVLASVSVLGLALQGHASRVSPAVLALDRSRTEPVPWQSCAGKPTDKACRLGDPEARPDVLLWGDSHMVAWAPALDRLMAEARRGAVLAAHLACAPLVEVRLARNRACQPANEEVWAFLQAHPEIRTVVLAAYWGHYFQAHSSAEAWAGPGQRLQGLEAARQGLDATLSRLVNEGRAVVLIGPVPTYTYNVPQTLALHAWRHQELPPVNEPSQRRRQQVFWQAAEAWRGVPQVKLLDPIDWFCPSDCAVQALGQVLYRDEQHINAAGARWAEAQLARDMKLVRAPVQP